MDEILEIDVKDSIQREPMIHANLCMAYVERIELGIPFVDDVLLGVLKSDFMLIGAKTGVGKTQILTEIAKYNAAKGKRVLFIALEAEPEEIEQRLFYQILSGLFFQDQDRDRSTFITYRSWRFGLLQVKLEKYQNRAREIFRERYRTLKTVYRHSAFTLAHLYQTLEMVAGSFDMVILDHLHYFDLEFKRDDQNQAMGKLIKEIRGLNHFHGVPFVAAAHLRKDIEGVTPDVSEFMGTSELGKIATTCIMLTPRVDGFEVKSGISETVVTIPKSRTGGVGNLCGILSYSVPLQSYASTFRLGKITKGNTKVEELKEDEWPEWLKRQEKNVIRLTLGQ